MAADDGHPSNVAAGAARRQKLITAVVLAFLLYTYIGQPVYDYLSKSQVNATQADVGCNYAEDRYGTDAAPFEYYTYSSNGNKQVVNATRDPVSGLCTFPKASCTTARSSQPCCESSPWSNEQFDSSQWLFNLASNVVVFLPIMLFSMWNAQRARQAAIQGSSPGSEPLLPARPAAAAEPHSGIEPSVPASPPPNRSCCGRCLAIVGLMAILAAIGCEIYAAIIKQQMTQQMLPLVERNAMVSTDAFLTPLHEVFQFLEDVVTVKINFALAMGSSAIVRSVLQVGVFGGILLGVVGASIVTAVASWPAGVEAILVPSAGPDSLHALCTLLPDVKDIVGRSYLYLVLNAWRWPMSFANMALRGYLFGCGDFKIMGILFATTILENGVKVALFLIIFPLNPSLDVMAWFDLAGSAAAFVTNIACILHLLRKQEQRTTQSGESSGNAVDLKRSLSGKVMDSISRAHSDVWQTAAQEGLCAMVLDLSLQLSISGGIYATGAWLGSGGLYQISALQCALVQYGLSTISGITYQLKMQGAGFVGKKQFLEFRKFIVSSTFIIFGVGVSGVCATLPFRTGLSFALGANACEYASEAACLPVYTSVFGGMDTDATGSLQSSFDVFAPILFSMALFRVLKVGLYCCFDFTFMAVVGAATFVCVFLPGLYYVSTLPNLTTKDVLVVMYAPALCMAIAFLARLYFNTEKMLRGKEGPWTANTLSREEPSF